MGYDRCKTCNEWHWDNTPCNPIFKVFDEEYMGDESMEFYASNHEAAAIKYASYYNSRCDYNLINNEREVTVEDDKEKQMRFIITAEPSIHYSASLVS